MTFDEEGNNLIQFHSSLPSGQFQKHDEQLQLSCAHVCKNTQHIFILDGNDEWSKWAPQILSVE